MGVKGTRSLPKVGLVLTFDVRPQPDQADHLFGEKHRAPHNREIIPVVEVVEVVEVVVVEVVVVVVEVVVCCMELRLMAPIYQSGAEQ